MKKLSDDTFSFDTSPIPFPQFLDVAVNALEETFRNETRTFGYETKRVGLMGEK